MWFLKRVVRSIIVRVEAKRGPHCKWRTKFPSNLWFMAQAQSARTINWKESG